MPAGQTPYTVCFIACADLVDKIHPGERVTVTGYTEQHQFRSTKDEECKSVFALTSMLFISVRLKAATYDETVKWIAERTHWQVDCSFQLAWHLRAISSCLGTKHVTNTKTSRKAFWCNSWRDKERVQLGQTMQTNWEVSFWDQHSPLRRSWH